VAVIRQVNIAAIALAIGMFNFRLSVPTPWTAFPNARSNKDAVLLA
jgi:hypothetical protein